MLRKLLARLFQGAAGHPKRLGRKIVVVFSPQIPEWVTAKYGQSLIYLVPQLQLDGGRKAENKRSELLIEIMQLQSIFKSAARNEALCAWRRQERTQIDLEAIVVVPIYKIRRVLRV